MLVVAAVFKTIEFYVGIWPVIATDNFNSHEIEKVFSDKTEHLSMCKMACILNNYIFVVRGLTVLYFAREAVQLFLNCFK